MKYFYYVLFTLIFFISGCKSSADSYYFISCPTYDAVGWVIWANEKSHELIARYPSGESIKYIIVLSEGCSITKRYLNTPPEQGVWPK